MRDSVLAPSMLLFKFLAHGCFGCSLFALSFGRFAEEEHRQMKIRPDKLPKPSDAVAIRFAVEAEGFLRRDPALGR